MRKITHEFVDFLMEYKIVGVALAFIMGIATNDLIRSFVDNLIMPLTDPLLSQGNWQIATIAIGPFVFGWGPFLAALINFVIITLVVFIVIKKLLLSQISKGVRK